MFFGDYLFFSPITPYTMNWLSHSAKSKAPEQCSLKGRRGKGGGVLLHSKYTVTHPLKSKA